MSLRDNLRPLLVVLCLAPHLAFADTAVLGYWAGDDSILHITDQGGQLSARVAALGSPTYEAGEDFGPVGTARRDDNNPDDALKGRPVLGLELLEDYRYNGTRWEGKIYDPASGNTYSSRMRVDADELKMRGYIGVPMLGRTATFTAVSVCSEHVRDLLAKSDLKYDAACNIAP